MPSSSVDVLIVGAGPVGLTAAAALLHQGATVRIVDKAPSPSDKSKALAVWCRSLELLDRVGLAETFVQTGLKLSGGSMYAEGNRVVHLDLTSDESPYGFPLMIPQNETERLLTEHVSRCGVAIERQVELASFGEHADGVRCVLRHSDGQEETCDVAWLVGCDGAHSTVRHQLGLTFDGYAEPNDWMLADVHIDGSLARDEVSVFWSAEGVIAFFPIDRDRFRMIADLGPASAGAPPADPTLEEAQAMADSRGPAGLRFSDPVWLANFRINERKVRDYRLGRVLLAGDAAHIHSPAGGQGMNTGMQDAFNLAWKLALVQKGQGQAEPLLASYSLERSAVGDQVLKNAQRFTTMATLRSPVAQWLRNHIVPVLGSLSFVRDKIRDDWFELSIEYRDSPLSGGRRAAFERGLAPGDRMGDATLRSAVDGRPTTTLFAELRDPRHALLLLPGASAPNELSELAASVERRFPGVCAMHLVLKAGVTVTESIPTNVAPWFDATGRLYEQLHVTGSGLFLVRPDGYLAFCAHSPDAAGLLQHLDSYLIARL